MLVTSSHLWSPMTSILQLTAVFEEQGGPLIHHNGGDGTSASSVGTSSPDIFQARDQTDDKAFRPYLRHDGSKNDVIITQSDLDAGWFHNVLLYLNSRCTGTCRCLFMHRYACFNVMFYSVATKCISCRKCCKCLLISKLPRYLCLSSMSPVLQFFACNLMPGYRSRCSFS